MDKKEINENDEVNNENPTNASTTQTPAPTVEGEGSVQKESELVESTKEAATPKKVASAPESVLEESEEEIGEGEIPIPEETAEVEEKTQETSEGEVLETEEVADSSAASQKEAEGSEESKKQPIEIIVSDEIKEKLDKIDDLSAEEIKDILDGFNVQNEEGVITFNDPIIGAKFAAKYRELTGQDHDIFRKEALKVTGQIQDDQELLMEADGKTYNAQYFQNIKVLSYALDGRPGYELVSTFPGERKGWNTGSPQLMSKEAIETMFDIAGKKLVIADQGKMLFNGQYDLVTLARANEVYKQMTGHSHPRYEEMLPELVEKERDVLLDAQAVKRQPLSKLKMTRAIIDAYDLESVDLSEALFTDKEREGVKLRAEREGKSMPEDRKDAEQLLTSPEGASFEEISFMLDHIGTQKFHAGQDEIEGLIDIDTIEKLNNAFKQFSGGKSHPRYLTVVPLLIKQEQALEKTTDERRVELADLSEKIELEAKGDKPILQTGEKFVYKSHEKTSFERMMIDPDNTPTDVMAKHLHDFVMRADAKAITVDDLATITKLREILKGRGHPENPEVETFLTRVANAKNQSKELEEQTIDQKVEKEKGETIITGRGAAVLVTAEMFGKIGRGVAHLVKKAMHKIKDIRKKNLEKKQAKEEAVKGDTAQTKRPNKTETQVESKKREEGTGRGSR